METLLRKRGPLVVIVLLIGIISSLVIIDKFLFSIEYLIAFMLLVSGVTVYIWLMKITRESIWIDNIFKRYTNTILCVLIVFLFVLSLYLLLCKPQEYSIISNYLYYFLRGTGIIGMLCCLYMIVKSIKKKKIITQENTSFLLLENGDQEKNNILNEERIIQDAEKYTTITFHSYLNEQDTELLIYYIRGLIKGEKLISIKPASNENLRLKPTDIIRYGWNIYKHFCSSSANSRSHKENVAGLLKSFFLESLKEWETSSILKKMKNNDGSEKLIPLYETKKELENILNTIK